MTSAGPSHLGKKDLLQAMARGGHPLGEGSNCNETRFKDPKEHLVDQFRDPHRFARDSD